MGKLDYIDRYLSGWIHTCVVKPSLLEFIIFPFAFMFQAPMFPFIVTAVGVFLPVLEEQQRQKYHQKGVRIEKDYDGEDEYKTYIK